MGEEPTRPDRDTGARWKTWAGVALVLAAIAALYAPSWAARFENGRHPLVLNDDARQQIHHFYRYAPSGTFADDLISDYYLSFYPILWKGLYTGLAAADVDLSAVSDLLPHALMAAAVAALAAAAHTLGGLPAAFGTAALFLGAATLWTRSGGAVPHSFSLLVMALGIAALVRGRARALAAVTALAPGFYPVAGVLLGGALFGLLFVVRSEDRGEARAWSFRRRAAWLAATAGLAALVALPSAVGSLAWGPRIGPELAAEYPEAGRRGRYGPQLSRPWKDPHELAPTAFRAGLAGTRVPWSRPFRVALDAGENAPRRTALGYALSLAGALGLVCLASRSRAARRILVLPLAALAGHAASVALDPLLFLPNRYVGHTLPLLAPLLVPVSLGAWAPAGWRRATATLLGTTLILGMVGGPIGERRGVGVDARSQRAVFELLESTPEHATIAGWPGGPIETMPIVSRRSAFVTYETHQALHAAYLDEMRRRMDALIAAYFATDRRPLLLLRDELGVTHLLVNLAHYENPPTYFQPFLSTVRRTARRSRGREEVVRLVDAGVGRRVGNHVLIDLAALGGHSRPAGTDTHAEPSSAGVR